MSLAIVSFVAPLADEADKPPLLVALFSLVLGAALLRFSRVIGDGLSWMYRSPGLPQRRSPDPGRAQFADFAASFWTWAFRLFGVMLSGFAVYVVIAHFV